MGFQGSVESFSLADVFQSLATNQLSGTLRVFLPNGEERFLAFEKGLLRCLSHGREKPLLLGDMLAGRGLITDEQVQQALERQKQNHEALGACLVNLGYLTEKQVDEAVRHQTEEEVFELFAWENAQYEFVDGPPPEGLFVEHASTSLPGLPVAHLIMEAARRVDEWERLQQQIPSFREVFVVEAGVADALAANTMTLEDVDRRVLGLLDGRRDVEEVIRDSRLFRYEVFQALAGFLQSSIIRAANAEELGRSAEVFRKSGEKGRLARNLEGLLALGVDRPEIRRELAECLIEAGQGDKAAIHLSLLADAELKAGRQENAIALFRRILQSVPQHLPSRERLGSLYLERVQKREALIQFQELTHAHCASKQWAEAHTAAERALVCDPTSVDVHRDLIQILIAQEDRAGAARECEVLGDILARQGRAKEASEQYRRASQLVPGQRHLRKKLAKVMLSSEDRRMRSRRLVMLAAAVLALFLGGAWLANRETELLAQLRAAHQAAERSVLAARTFESSNDFESAAAAYGRAAQEYTSRRLLKSYSVLGTQLEAQRAAGTHQRQQDIALQQLERMKRDQFAQANQDLEVGRRALFEDEDLYAARDRFRRVLANLSALPEEKQKATEWLAQADKKIVSYEQAQQRLSRPPQQAFRDVEEELQFKRQFLRDFGAMPQVKADLEKPADARRYYLPIRLLPSEDEVQVRLDGSHLTVVGRQGDVVRYPFSGPHTLALLKDGYRPVSLNLAADAPSQISVRLEREPAKTEELERRLVGGACYDGRSLWVGLSEGGLLQVDPDSLRPVGEFRSPVGKGLMHEVYGPPVAFRVGDQNCVAYATQGGQCVVAQAGRETPVFPPQRVEGQLGALPALLQLPMAGGQLLFLAPLDQRLAGVQAERGAALWGTGLSAPVGTRISTPPAVLASDEHDRKALLVVGGENGRLYGLRVGDGTVDRVWEGRGPAICGVPVVTETLLLACDVDGGLLFFQHAGGKPVAEVNLGGRVSGAPLLWRKVLFAGASARPAFVAVDLERRTVHAIPRDELKGGIATSPFRKESRLFFAADADRPGDAAVLYAADWTGADLKLAWSCQVKGSRRAVGPPVAVRNKIYFFMDNGKVLAFSE